MGLPTITARIESWPIAGQFRIARGAKTEAVVVVVEVRDKVHAGRGECVPYSRYGETPEATIAQVLAASAEAWPNRGALMKSMAPGAARNGLDCALWDFEAKHTGHAAARLAGLTALSPVQTFYTISIDAPLAMAAKAASVPSYSALKLKLGARDGQDAARMREVRQARPDARLAADANEGWDTHEIAPLLAVAAEEKIEVVEQPLPAGADDGLVGLDRPVPVCADESVHTTADLERLKGRYDAVNVKLDKAGGLTEALLMTKAARSLGFMVMVGSMVSTSLSIAPAFLLAQDADWVDLDGPLLLARDREFGFTLEAGHLLPPDPRLWG